MRKIVKSAVTNMTTMRKFEIMSDKFHV